MVTSGGAMTLVFKRAAVERLADPAAAFADAEAWTEAIGLVSDDAPERLSSYAREERLDPDVISSARGQTGGLAVIRQQFSTERHVFVGTSDDDQELAEALGWEFLDIAEAADAAGWTLAADAGQWRDERA